MKRVLIAIWGLAFAGVAVDVDAQVRERGCAGLIITEIMYDPSTTQGPDSTNEWVEIYNDSCDAVDLSGWTIQDLIEQDPILPKVVFPMDGGSAVLPPGRYALIIDGEGSEVLTNSAWDIAPGTRIFGTDDLALGNGLNNSPETVAIRDAQGNIVDQVMYQTTDTSGCGNEANGKGYSLERVDPFGPGDCSNFRSMELLAENFPIGGTPGADNFLWLGSSCFCVGAPAASTWGLALVAVALLGVGILPLRRRRLRSLPLAR